MTRNERVTAALFKTVGGILTAAGTYTVMRMTGGSPAAFVALLFVMMGPLLADVPSIYKAHRYDRMVAERQDKCSVRY